MQQYIVELLVGTSTSDWESTPLTPYQRRSATVERLSPLGIRLLFGLEVRKRTPNQELSVGGPRYTDCGRMAVQAQPGTVSRCNESLIVRVVTISFK